MPYTSACPIPGDKGKTMTKFVIRSMTTTDFDWRAHTKKVTPYHLYLMKPECRRGAYWSTRNSDTMLFDSIEAALDHGKAALNKNDDWSIRMSNDNWDVVPLDDRELPTFWDVRNDNSKNRLIGDQIILATL